MRKNAKFDRDQVVDKAVNLYWEKGYHGTSMRNLQDVIDMRPGSIYATFGSKDGLFREALERYALGGLQQLEQLRQETGSPTQALKEFIKLQVIGTLDSAPSNMCMLTKSVAELTSEQPELLAEAKGLLKRVEQAFVRLLIEAQEMGELDSSGDVDKLARHLQVQIAGLRTYARVSDGEAPLEEMIDDIFSHYPFRD